MGKGARNRRRRQLAATRPLQPAAMWNLVDGGPDERREKLIEVLEDTHMPCRATYSNDPLFGGPSATITDILPDGTLVTDPHSAIPALPVAMFETKQLLALKDLRTSMFHEPRIESIVSSGFHRIPRGILVNSPAEGWGLYRTSAGLMLRDRFGGVWADGDLQLDSGWVSEATSQGWVIVYYGPYMGIRLPEGKTEATYTLQERITDFRRGREVGLCAMASVRWHPAPLQETMNWVLLPPGIFHQPYPVAYVPAWHFFPFGGTEAFGLVPVKSSSAGIAAVGMARNLAVNITRTDVDFFQPHLDNDINFVAGYRVPGGRPTSGFTAWRQLPSSREGAAPRRRQGHACRPGDHRRRPQQRHGIGPRGAL